MAQMVSLFLASTTAFAADPQAAVPTAVAYAQRIHPETFWPNNSNLHAQYEWRLAGTSVMKCVQGQWDWGLLSTRPPATSWPEFQLRVTTDHKSFYGFGNPYNAKLPMAPSGTVFPAAGRPMKVQIADRSWASFSTLYQYVGGDVMEMTVSRLTPAALFYSRSARELNFFGDLLFDIIPKGAKDVQPKPRFIAFATKGGIKVLQGPGEFDIGSEMTEGWMLVWFGKHSYISATRLPTQQQYHWSNGTWPKRTLAHYDCPWLFVFGQKPSTVRLHEPVNVTFPNEPAEGDTTQERTFRYWEKRMAGGPKQTGRLKGMTVAFDGPAGDVAMMPLHGNRFILMAKTEGWGKGLPKSVANDCRRWNAILREFPVSAEETYELDEGTPNATNGVGDPESQSQLTVSVSIGYRQLGNPFNEKTEKFAPFPPILALAAERGFVKPSEKIVDLNCPGTTGPTCGIRGVDSYKYVIGGLDRYLWQRMAIPSPPAKAKDLASRAETHVKEMLDAGVLAPVLFMPDRQKPTPWVRFDNIGELAVSLELVRPLLSTDLQKRLVPYVEAQQKVSPFGSGRAPLSTGTPRAAYEYPESVRKTLTPIPAEYRPEDFYALGTWYDRYGELSGGVRLVKAIEEALTVAEEWNNGPLNMPDRPPPHRHQWSVGYTGLLNAYLQQAIGCARLADRLGRRDLVELAAYRFGKAAAQRVGIEQLIDYLYASKQLAVPATIDNWSEVLARSNGNGLFIPDHWRGPEDDVRSVASLDASGAEICAFLIWRGHATQFSPYMSMTPEIGRLFGDFTRDRCERAFARMEQRLPSWWLTRGAKTDYVHCEALYSPPDNAWQLLLMAAWAIDKDGPTLSARLDVPFCPGDFYHLQKLAAAASAYGDITWTDIRKEQDR